MLVGSMPANKFSKKPYRSQILLDSPLGEQGVSRVSSCEIRPNVVCIADN